MKNTVIVKSLCLTFLIIASLGIFSHTSQASTPLITINHGTSNISDASVEPSIYLSYPTQNSEIACQQALSCEYDVVDVDSLLSAITRLDEYKALTDVLMEPEYQLLIASIAIKEIDQKETTIMEFDLLWQGVSLSFHTLSFSELPYSELLMTASNAWMKMAQNKQIFSKAHLYTVLGASDYINELVLPDTIDSFSLSDKRLYSDPLQGAVARYAHPEYADAIIDVNTYPQLQAMNNNEPLLSSLANELEKDLQQLSQIAIENNYQLSSLSDVTEIEWNIDGKVIQGVSFEATAIVQDDEPLFATHYIFMKEDKFVKYSTNIPSRIADALVKTSISSIKVPRMSNLMKNIHSRQISIEIAEVD